MQNQCLPYEDYLLPAGHDPASGEVVEQLLVASPPLDRVRVLLAAGPDSEWGQQMAQILAAAGALVKHSDQVSTYTGQVGATCLVESSIFCSTHVSVFFHLSGWSSRVHTESEKRQDSI